MMYRCLEGAKIQAFIPPIVASPQGFRGGLVIEDSALFPLRQTRRQRPVDLFDAGAVYNNALRGEFSYAGPLYDHFGHFMAEMVHRIIPIKAMGLKKPFIFVTSSGNTPHKSYAHLPNYMKEILSYLEINASNLVVVSENTTVEKLHVVEQGADISGGPKEGYLDKLRKFAERRLNEIHGSSRRPEKIYVSRSGLVPTGSILGERYFEQCLEQNGFTVFRPEEYRFTPQMDYYRKAKTVIFPEGSACHGTELLGSEMMNSVFLMPRRSTNIARPFMSILSPRSKHAEFMEECVEYLGTALQHRQVGSGLSHVGVSLIDARIMLPYLEHAGIAKLDCFSQAEYLAAARTDLDAYVAFTKKFDNFNVEWAENLKMIFEDRTGQTARPN